MRETVEPRHFFLSSLRRANFAYTAPQRKQQARESTQSAALQENHAQDVTRNFGRPSSCNAVRMTFGFRPETQVLSRFGALGRTRFDKRLRPSYRVTCCPNDRKFRRTKRSSPLMGQPTGPELAGVWFIPSREFAASIRRLYIEGIARR